MFPRWTGFFLRRLLLVFVLIALSCVVFYVQYGTPVMTSDEEYIVNKRSSNSGGDAISASPVQGSNSRTVRNASTSSNQPLPPNNQPRGPLEASSEQLNELESFFKNPNANYVKSSSNERQPFRFEYLIDPGDVCSPRRSSDASPILIVYVHSAPEHCSRRDVIRRTWGNLTYYNDTVRLVFVLGRAVRSRVENRAIEDVQQAVMWEAGRHKDIVQLDFADVYENMTLKAIGALQWLFSGCNQARFVLKTDDDAMVNMFALLRHLAAYTKTGNDTVKEASTSGLLLCNVWRNEAVARQGKWRISESVFRFKSWPTFCQGIAFLMSMDVAIAAFRTVRRVPRIWLDDVYLTGFVPLALGDINVHHVVFNSHYVPVKDIGRFADELRWSEAIFAHLRGDFDTIAPRLWAAVVARWQGRTPPPWADIYRKQKATQ